MHFWHNSIQTIYVYVIKSVGRNYVYVRQTNSIEKRVSQHNRDMEKITKRYAQFYILLTETFENRSQARQREKYLKSGIGKEHLKTIQ